MKNLKKIDFEQVLSKIKNIKIPKLNTLNIKPPKVKLPQIKLAEIAALLVVAILSCIVIVPSLVQCVDNRNKSRCDNHMNEMLSLLSQELTGEVGNDGVYWRELIQNGNYQKLIASINDKVGDGKKFPSSDYYMTTGEEKLTLFCKSHKDITDKSIKFSLMKDVSVDVAEKKQVGSKIAYLTVSGPDTYYENDILDADNPTKTVFKGREADKVIQNLTVCAVYVGGAREELPRSRYTITTDKLNMKKPGQTHILIKSDKRSLWDDSAYVPFVIDVIGKDDVAPLIVDADVDGKFELAAWEWSDYVEEAAMESGSKEFGASIVRYNGSYYYYPDGMRIENDKSNDNPFKYAFDNDSETNPAYYIKFDTDSVISNDDDKAHDGSVKVEDDFVYIWQEKPSKELDAGWIRVYCELKKY